MTNNIYIAVLTQRVPWANNSIGTQGADSIPQLVAGHPCHMNGVKAAQRDRLLEAGMPVNRRRVHKETSLAVAYHGDHDKRAFVDDLFFGDRRGFMSPDYDDPTAILQGGYLHGLSTEGDRVLGQSSGELTKKAGKTSANNTQPYYITVFDTHLVYQQSIAMSEVPFDEATQPPKTTNPEIKGLLGQNAETYDGDRSYGTFADWTAALLRERARRRRSAELERQYAPVRRMLAALNLDRKEGE